MRRSMIDSHIHLDMYEEDDRISLLQELESVSVDSLIAVSNDLASSTRQLEFARMDARVKPAIGYHPEQELPSEEEVQSLFDLIDAEKNRIAAIGEVGLPYYLRKKNADLEVAPYITLLERFIEKAASCNIPIVLHAVYEDAETACDLLEKHGVTRAHFHWFKGDDRVLARILEKGYTISVTPDVTYESDIQKIVKQVPLSQLMVETDGPWPFDGRFSGRLTHPCMMHDSIQTIAALKGTELKETYRQLYDTTVRLYGLAHSFCR